MPLRLLTVTHDAREPARVAQFWADLLGREVVEDGGGAFLPGNETQLGLQFVPSLSDKVGPNRIHLHLTSTSADDQDQIVAKAVALGARHIDVGQLPEEGHVVLADPEGNELCVIEPGNAFLAGCGFLGEIACEGTREVGLFWSEALGWPLVWDQDQETAIQSPHGGTKVSWGGEAVTPHVPRNRQRLNLVGGDPAEIARLVGLGATRLGGGPEGGGGGASGSDAEGGDFALADPDGNEFWVHAG